MSDEPQPDEAPRLAPQVVFYLVPLLIVLAVGVLFFAGGGNSPLSKNEQEERAKPPTKVEAGEDYYVLVTVMEFHTTQPDGDDWDAGGSAPDIFYYLEWHGQEIFSTENDVAEDVLIAKWFGLGADFEITDLGRILLPSGKRLSPRNAIKAGLFSAAEGDELVIRAFDHDLVNDDRAGRCVIGVMDLKLGDNVFFIDANGHVTRDAKKWARNRGGLARLVLRVVDSSLPIEGLVKALR